MTKDEALKMAIDYLGGSYEAHKVRKACQEALAQPEQELVEVGTSGTAPLPKIRYESYQWQGNKEFVELSVIDISELSPNAFIDENDIKFARAIEQALRNKNDAT
jgi:hypothetical protein